MIGTHKLSKIFSILRDQLRSKGYISDVFTFVDVSHLISKAQLWEETDAARKKRDDKLNNKVLPKVAHDKQARIGCKGNHKFWYGYKKHVSVDMQSGLINKVAITPGNLTDAKGFKHVCPRQGAVYADKEYCTSSSIKEATTRGVHLGAIKKNNMRGKNFDLDHFYSQVRAPFERVFSQDRKQAALCWECKKSIFSVYERLMFQSKTTLCTTKLNDGIDSLLESNIPKN